MKTGKERKRKANWWKREKVSFFDVFSKGLEDLLYKDLGIIRQSKHTKRAILRGWVSQRKDEGNRVSYSTRGTWLDGQAKREG